MPAHVRCCGPRRPREATARARAGATLVLAGSRAVPDLQAGGVGARARADRVGLRGSAQVRRNAHVEILPLSTGCLGACTYCKTRHARGALGSYALPALVGRARGALADPRARPRAARPGRPIGERAGGAAVTGSGSARCTCRLPIHGARPDGAARRCAGARAVAVEGGVRKG